MKIRFHVRYVTIMVRTWTLCACCLSLSSIKNPENGFENQFNYFCTKLGENLCSNYTYEYIRISHLLKPFSYVPLNQLYSSSILESCLNDFSYIKVPIYQLGNLNWRTLMPMCFVLKNLRIRIHLKIGLKKEIRIKLPLNSRSRNLLLNW